MGKALYIEKQNKATCFGCGACKAGCPVECITMKMDEEGFVYPVVDKEKCIHCGKCSSVCPYESVTQLLNTSYKPQVFSAVHKDKNTLYDSSSGGAFAAIIEEYCDADDMVCGVCYEPKLKVSHVFLPAYEAWEKFKKSKYVQSDTKNTFKETKEWLETDRKVVYTGTPCQIAGLKQYLGRDYDNLLTIEVVCHGVPSQKVFEQYIKEVEKRYKKTISKVEFRHKRFKNGRWDSKLLEVEFEHGKKKVFDYNTSEYLRAYAHGLCFRPSCMQCPFAQAQRVADLTIADFWGIHQYDSTMDEHEGVSLIIVNGEKGKSLVREIEKSMTLREWDYEKAIGGNARLRKPDSGHAKRQQLFDSLGEEAFCLTVREIIPAVPLYKRWGHEVKMFVRRRLRR